MVGADIDEEQLEKAGDGVARGIANVRFVRADLTGDLGEDIYDAVAAIECLEEIPDDDGGPGVDGSGPAPPRRSGRPCPRAQLDASAARQRPHLEDQVRHGYSPEELQHKLEEAGLRESAVHPTSRGAVRLAQELRDRIKTRGLLLQLLTLPASAAAVRLERLGVTWGAPRALFVKATRP